MNLLAVTGSLREKSFSGGAALLAMEAAARHGATPRLLELRTANLPMYNPDAEAPPSAAVAEVASAVDWADAFLLTSPDYHGSISGAMKNFLDYHWDPLAGKLFGFVIASHEKGLTVMDQMRTVVRQCYGWSLPYGVSIHGKEDFDDDGNLKSQSIARRLDMLGRDLAVYGDLLRKQFVGDRDGTATNTFAARYRG